MTDTPVTISVPSSDLERALAVEFGILPPALTVLPWRMDSPAPATSIDIVVVPYMGPTAESLPWLTGMDVALVQSQSIGYDGIENVLPPGFVFANAASVHETSTAELTLALILASQRAIPDFVRAASAGSWRPSREPSLADRSVLLVGFGGVGKATEARLLPFETDVVRVARTARTDERGAIHAMDELSDLLPQADIVVIGVPLSESTHHLVDADFLSRMQDGALLVNIARGPVVDTDALLAEVGTGRLRAALDVTDPEPLPDGHPLFGLPNVLISPHVGGATSAMMPRMARLLRAQIERMLRGDEPLNIVYRS